MENPEKQTLVSKVIELFQVVFRKCSKIFDKIVFNKKGSILISLLLALFISISINYEDISLQLFHDTTTSITLDDISVETKADTDDYVIEGIPSTVDVTIKGTASEVQVYRQQGKIRVIADLRKYEEGDVLIDLMVYQLPQNLEATITPSTVEAKLIKKMTKQYSLSPEIILGAGQKQSDFEKPVLASQTVKIKASQEQLDSIRSVKAIVDTTGQNSDFEADATIVAYDSKGNKVQVDIEPATVSAQVSLASKDEEEN